ncbi:hypothetical protein NUW58_g569 [Xylaria curta]|uniref:Uncharacterized protein n=1 Tax=Xylaria curta TaxID=42375 RepID=A0ACC1PPS0_9PEZI|nr:hypothetical protein NUW58_g569 [Xylaria curta]
MTHHVQWPQGGASDNDAEPLVDSQSTKLRFEQDVYTVPLKTRKTWRKRLGTVNLITLVLGTAIIVTLHISLAIFWAQCLVAIGGEQPIIAWRRIVKAGWATKAITLIRRCCGAILGRTSRPLHVDDGSAGAGEELPIRVAEPEADAVTKVLASPAALADDYRDTGNLGDPELPSSVTVASSYTSSINGVQDYWSMPLLGNWRFGENSEPFTIGTNFHDTGHTYRAFLPLTDEQERANLREFHGPADILDTRVVCLSPDLSNLVLTRDSSSTFALTGNMSFDLSYPMPHNTHSTPTDQPVEINCPMVVVMNHPTNDTAPNQTSLCNLVNSTVLLDDTLVDPVTTSGDMGAAELRASSFFLIADFIPVVLANGIGGDRTDLTIASTDGPWSIIADPSGENVIRATACLVNLGSNVFNVAMHSRVDGPEPLTHWDREANSYNTIASRRQLGVSMEPESLEDRGLLELELQESWDEIDVTQFSAIPTFYASYARYSDDIGNAMSRHMLKGTLGVPGLGIFLSNTTIFDDSAHVSHVALFQDSLRATNSPALALQALLTRVCQMIYYFRLDRAPPIGQATTIFSSNVLIPTRWTGFLVATLISATQLCVLATVTVVFLWRSDKSELGSLWQAIAQIVTRGYAASF